MHKKTYLAGIVVLLAAALALAACSSPSAPAAPTADANAVYTQAAATVAANLTQDASKNPTDTPTFAPPTDTPTTVNALPAVTDTPSGSPNTTVTTTPLATGTQATATKSSSLLVPTATKASGPAPVTGDKAEWVSQGPTDGSSIPVSATFNVVYVLKNTGTTTWTTQYTLRFYAGDQMSSPKDTNITKVVKPGETVQIPFVMIAPSSAGKTHTIWAFSNADGVNFYYVTMDLVIK